MQHKLLFILVICIVAAGVGVGLWQSGPAEPLLTTTAAEGTPVSASAGGADEEIVGILLSLGKVSLTGAIFLEPAFRILEDSGTTIRPEPQGRMNPFAPLEAAPPPVQDEPPAPANSQRSNQIFTPRSR